MLLQLSAIEIEAAKEYIDETESDQKIVVFCKHGG
jgi:hypothetical protein